MNLLYFIIAIATAMIGNQIHKSIFWTIIDFFFWPIVWLKWFVFREVTVTIIREAFAWFLK